MTRYARRRRMENIVAIGAIVATVLMAAGGVWRANAIGRMHGLVVVQDMR